MKFHEMKIIKNEKLKDEIKNKSYFFWSLKIYNNAFEIAAATLLPPLRPRATI